MSTRQNNGLLRDELTPAQHELVTWSRFTWGLARCKGLLSSRPVPAGVLVKLQLCDTSVVHHAVCRFSLMPRRLTRRLFVVIVTISRQVHNVTEQSVARKLFQIYFTLSQTCEYDIKKFLCPLNPFLFFFDVLFHLTSVFLWFIYWIVKKSLVRFL